MIREATLQSDLVKRVRLLGGMVVKLAPTVKGLPDLLVLLPTGGMYLVELKTDVGQLSPAQRVLHDRIRALGIEVHVLRGPGEIQAWLRKCYEEIDEVNRKGRSRSEGQRLRRQREALQRLSS